jgi:hypothetical protein
MRSKSILLSAGLIFTLTVGSLSPAFAQTPVAQNRIAQQVVIGGLRVDAATVIAPGGGVQSYSCPGPQQYVTPDGASQGWACFDPITNVWLLSALPPQPEAPAVIQAPVQAPPPPVVVQQVIQQPVYAPPVVYQYPVVQPVYAPVYAPAVVYRAPARVVYAAPVYSAPVSSSAVIAASAITAAGLITSAVIANSGHNYYRGPVYVVNHGHRR